MKKWRIREVDENVVTHIREITGYPRGICKVLFHRGIRTEKDLSLFVYPTLDKLENPFVFKDMNVVVSKIWDNILNKTSILIFGDYDADGITSSSLLYKALKKLGAIVDVAIPNREEGYGLSKSFINKTLLKYRPLLIITTDNGVNAKNEVEYIKSLGIDIIITDHHEPDENISSPLAMINPKTENIPELKNIAGVGVAFKVIQAVLSYGKSKGYINDIDASRYLDIVAIGTVGDAVPLLGENRILVKHGLNRVNETKDIGIKYLLDTCGIKNNATAYSLGYKLCPRINAAGRMGDVDIALNLFLSEDPKESYELAASLDKINIQRRDLEQAVLKEAIDQVDTYFDDNSTYGLVVANKDWNPGVIGIVAARLTERYDRPSIVLSIDENGIAKGSCRSTQDIDILELLTHCSDVLTRYGGHKGAAGCELTAENIPLFREKLNKYMMSIMSIKDMVSFTDIDAELTPYDIGWDFYNKLTDLEPFGKDNPEPIWLLKNIPIRNIRVINGTHCSFVININNEYNAIFFNANKPIYEGVADMCFTLKKNIWKNNESLQLQIVDIIMKTSE